MKKNIKLDKIRIVGMNEAVLKKQKELANYKPEHIIKNGVPYDKTNRPRSEENVKLSPPPPILNLKKPCKPVEQKQNEDDTKDKVKITIDSMMIIGKYLEKSQDYVNVMKTTKRYHDLTQMYHFNPISDTSLFDNMETQYLYTKDDVQKKGMIHYIHWYEVDYETFKLKTEKNIYKRFILKSENEITNSDDLSCCTVPEGCSTIVDNCFKDSVFEEVVLPSTLRRIGENAFSGSSLTSISIPNGVTFIGKGCFEECTSLTSVTLPST